MTKNRAILTLGSLCVAGLTVMLIFVSLFMDNRKCLWEDAIHYYGAAENLVNTGAFGYDPEIDDEDVPFGLEPVYSLFAAPFAFFWPGNFLPIRIMQSLIITLSCLLFYRILRVFLGKGFALSGAALYLFYPFHIFFSGMILPEGIYMPVLVGFTYLTLMYIERKKTKYLYGSIAVLALLGHIKVTSWSLGLVSMLAFFLVNTRINRALLVRALVCAAIFFAICIPWGVRNYVVYEKISIPRNFRARKGNTALNKMVKKQTKSGFKAGTYACRLFSPTLMSVASENRFNQNLSQYVSIVSVTPLLAACLLLLFFRRDRKIVFLYVLLFSYSLPYLAFGGQTRYRLPIDFVMIAFLAILSENLTGRFGLLKTEMRSDI